MRRLTLRLVTALMGLYLLPGHAMAGVRDPLAALKTMYAGYRPHAAPSTPTIDTLYLWADRNLKRKLLANNVCTVPFRKRDITCALATDPAVAGVQAQLPEPVFEMTTPSTNERHIAVTFLDEIGKVEVHYRFARNGTEWELVELEARPPQGSSWKLSEIVGRE